jgi:FtsH-binding integral membrane protein
MAVYGSSPFTAYASKSFDAGYDKHKTPVAIYALESPSVALTQSLTAAAAAHHATSQRRMLHMHPLVVFMLLACVLSAAYVMRPDEEGTGNTYQAFSLLRRTDALQKQQQQQLVRTPAVICCIKITVSLLLGAVLLAWTQAEPLLEQACASTALGAAVS